MGRRVGGSATLRSFSRSILPATRPLVVDRLRPSLARTHQRRESRPTAHAPSVWPRMRSRCSWPSVDQRPLRDELDDLGLKLPARPRGYHQVPFALLLWWWSTCMSWPSSRMTTLCAALRGRPQRTLEGRRWMRQHWSGTGDTMGTNATPDLYGYDEFIEQYLGDLTPMQRLKGLAPERGSRASLPRRGSRISPKRAGARASGPSAAAPARRLHRHAPRRCAGEGPCTPRDGS
jgi:hypothetical protein